MSAHSVRLLVSTIPEMKAITCTNSTNQLVFANKM
jgi:hypothetical protein